MSKINKVPINNKKIGKGKEPETVITKVDETFEIRKGNYGIVVKINKDGSLTIYRDKNFMFSREMGFVFKESKKEVVRAIGELLIKASWLGEK